MLTTQTTIGRGNAFVCTTGLLTALWCASFGLAQSSAPSAASSPAYQPAPAGTPAARPPSGTDRKRATKLFLQASKLFQKEQFEQALEAYEQAATLDPANSNYTLAAELARSHAVTALIQTAARDRIRGDALGERAALSRALELDPRNIQVTEHLHELGDDALRGQAAPLYAESSSATGAPIDLEPQDTPHSFHIRADKRQAIQQVFKAYGLEATVDDSVRPGLVRVDVDDATFAQAMRILSLLTNSFYVPLDAHRALVARDTPENRTQFERQVLETVYLPGLTSTELSDVSTLAKNVFDVKQAAVDPGAGTLTLRAPEKTLDAFNATVRDLIDGHNQVLLEVRLIQIAHTSDRNTGIQPPQTITAFNVYAEEQSILNANQALVQQIISSGLAAPGDTLAILGILLASGQVSSSIFSNGIALFGGGLTQSALSPGPAKVNFNLNSSDSRELELMQLRLQDGEAGTIKSGTRYPIQTSSFSSLSGSVPSIPGLTGVGSSSALSSLLSSLSAVPNVPQVQYQDLGLTLKATPNVMRNGDVALNVDLKIDALAGSSINGNPILDNRAYSGVVSLKNGEGVVVVSQLSKSQSRAISGVPGLSEIPGLNNITDIDRQKNYSTLLIIMTPHVIRGTQAAGHTPMIRVEKDSAGR